MNILTVPIRVDAFIAQSPEPVVLTGDDFSNLPFVNQQKIDIHYETPNLASSVDKAPLSGFEYLPPGVHLHWNMPDAMTKGEINDTGISMPTVPNRWLVRRVHQHDVSQVKSWIVESDYLYPHGVVPERAVTIPAFSSGNQSAQPWEYMGRQLPLEQWLNEPEQAKQSHRYLPNLNVMGWGTAYFATFYTDCFSVFGFHDEAFSNQDVRDYTYEIYGWYSNPEQDFVRKKLNQKGISQAQQAKEFASWIMQAEQQQSQNLAACVCYGKVEFADDMSLTDQVYVAETTVALAKTPAEAAAVFLSKRQVAKNQGTPEEAVKLENQILALLFTDDAEGLNIDHINHLKTSRHRAEFRGIEAGKLWETLNEANVVKDIDDPELKQRVLDAIGEVRKTLALSTKRLNILQEKLNQSHQRCDYHRRMLYNDWSKYMMSIHPVDAAKPGDPEIDEVRLLITQQSIPALQAELERKDELLEQVASQAEQFEEDYRQWKDPFEAEGAILPEKLLELKAAPGYWQANDPYLLIAGDVVKPSLRHGADGQLSCDVYQTDLPTVQAWLLKIVGTSGWHWQSHGVNHWVKQPWSTLLVEWEANLYPDESARKSFEGRDANYIPDFISSRYRIPLNDGQFGLPGASVDLRQNGKVRYRLDEIAVEVKGRTLISYAIKNVLGKKMQEYVEQRSQMSEKLQDVSSVTVNMEAVSDLLAQSECALVSLEGLNNQLIMYSDMSLLDINDPFRFNQEEDPHVSEQVSALLKGHSFKLPATGQRFMPIKSGITKLGVLRLVDSFGRSKNIDCADILRPERELVGNAVYSPPRVMQPLRLSCRWLEKQKEKSMSPIQGWLGYNTFDETLNFFDDEGEFMGLINSDGEWCEQYGLNQSLAPDVYRPMQEYVLKLLTFHNYNRISKQKFVSQSAGNETLWQKLIDAGALRELSSKKALLIPTNKNDWEQRIAPKCGLSFDASRPLFIRARRSNNYWPKLKQAIRTAIENIEPVSNLRQSPFGSIKPFAIVKAELDLQLLGGPETDKSFEALKLDLVRLPRTNREYTAVKFPIKLGEFNNLDDGLVAYWRVFEGHQLLEDGHFPQSYMDDVDGYMDTASFDSQTEDFVDKIRQQGVANLTQSLQEEPITLMMLIDPEAEIHVTTGIVPKQALSLPSDAYAAAVEKIRGFYFIAPLLTPSDKMVLPLPGDDSWQWLYPSGDKNNPYHLAQRNMELLDKARFIEAGGQEHDWQWLQVQGFIRDLEDQSGQAVLLPKTGHLETGTQIRLTQLAPFAEQALQPGLVERTVIKGIPARVRVVEGWLSSSSTQPFSTPD